MKEIGCFITHDRGVLDDNLRQVDFEIKNSYNKCLHVNVTPDEVKKYFGEGAVFSHFYEESLGEKTDQRIEFVIPPKKMGTLKAYFDEYFSKSKSQLGKKIWKKK